MSTTKRNAHIALNYLAVLGDGTLAYFRDLEAAQNWTRDEGFNDDQPSRQRTAARQEYLDSIGAKQTRRPLEVGRRPCPA